MSDNEQATDPPDDCWFASERELDTVDERIDEIDDTENHNSSEEIAKHFKIDMRSDDGGIHEDLQTFLERHSLTKLVEAHEATIRYRREDLTVRLAADEIDLDTYEAMTIISLLDDAIDASDHEFITGRLDD